MTDLSSLTPGLSAVVQHQVSEASTARHMLSGSVEVLSTPMLVGYMEEAAVAALVERLPGGFTTVGTYIGVEHIAPTPVGLEVTVRATLKEIDGRLLDFEIVAQDELEEIGRATHQRVIVDFARFMDKANSKLG